LRLFVVVVNAVVAVEENKTTMREKILVLDAAAKVGDVVFLPNTFEILVGYRSRPLHCLTA
jgi:hypothetical protein